MGKEILALTFVKKNIQQVLGYPIYEGLKIENLPYQISSVLFVLLKRNNTTYAISLIHDSDIFDITKFWSEKVLETY